jgi:Periplasmic component of the Tol biopolymer transport system
VHGGRISALTVAESRGCAQPSRVRAEVMQQSVAIAIAALAALAVFGVRFWHNAHPGQPTLIQLTSGAGLTMDPAVSPDGKLLAYVSDRADGRNLNIWIQQLAPAGAEVQLTHFDSDTRQPSFSPDGSRIVFYSTDSGGEIYAIPTIGGEPTRLAPHGRNPIFSPDGKWIAYWTGIPNKPAVTGGEEGEVYLLPASGGQPRRLAADLANAGNPVWSPDSKRLMVFSPTASDEFDWFVISPKGEPSTRTSIFESLKRQGFSIGLNRVPHLSQWTPGFILFSAVHGDAFNVWRMPVSGEGRSMGPAERLTSGTTLEASGLLTPSGKLIFASLNLVQSIWNLPLDADRARVTGELKKLTDGPTEAEPSISLDGRKLVFVVNQNARPNSELLTPGQPSTFQVRVKDLSTGKDVSIPDAEPQQLHPQISRDGTLVSFTRGDRIQIFRIDRQRPRMLVETDKGSGKIWDWSADNKRLLLGRYPQPNIYAYDVSSRRDSLFLPGDDLYQARFSPSTVILNRQAAGFSSCR